ncbi:MAG: hypothetical protein WCO81_13990 [Cyanobacteriota bacterium ELA615]
MLNSYPQKITSMWISFLLGSLFHTELGLMPLFHNLKVEQSEVQGNLDAVFGFMLFFFTIPMLLIIFPSFIQNRNYRRWQFGLTIAYSLMNFGHLIADIIVRAPWYQLILMLLLFLIGLTLNLVSFQWLKSS